MPRTNLENRKEISKQQKLKKIGRVENNIIYKEKGKTITDTLAIEVKTKTARLNPEQIDMSKITKKNGPH